MPIWQWMSGARPYLLVFARQRLAGKRASAAASTQASLVMPMKKLQGTRVESLVTLCFLAWTGTSRSELRDKRLRAANFRTWWTSDRYMTHVQMHGQQLAIPRPVGIACTFNCAIYRLVVANLTRAAS